MINRLFVAAAIIGVGGWFVLLSLAAWWTFQPVNLSTIEQPIPILNAGHDVAVGDPIVMELRIDKPESANTVGTDRFLRCESGNLVTITSATRNLPPGRYTIISDDVLLPAKVTEGDVCEFLFRVQYRINPIRYDVVEYRSEPFTVVTRT